MKNNIKGAMILILLMSIVLGCYFGIYIINDLPLLYGTDLRPQWFLFYEEFRTLITNFMENGDLPFYSWDLFLGTNFYSSKSYYLMGDIYSYIGLLFNKDFFTTSLILEIIKFYVSGIAMYCYLKSYQFKDTTNIIGALLYAFSGWAIFFSGQLSFLSFYSFMPLYFLGIETYIKSNKKILFIAATAILLFTNFYFFFTISMLTPIYYLYRYIVINGNFCGAMKNVLQLIVYYLVGVSITMALTLPTLFMILETDRISGISGNFFYDIQVYLHYLFSLLVPNYLYIYDINMFETNNHYSREICLYAGTITALLLPQISTFKDKISRNATYILYTTMFIMMTVTLFSSMLHGFGDPSLRWLLFVVFMNINIVAHFVDRLDLIDKKILKYTAILYVLVLCFLPVLTTILLKIDITNYIQQIIFALIQIIFIILLYFVITKENKYKQKLLILLVIVEIIYAGSTLFVDKIETSLNEPHSYTKEVTSVLQSEKNELNNNLNHINDAEGYNEYYRVYIPLDELYWNYSHNMSLIYDINGLMTYDSTYTTSLNKLKEIAPQIRDFGADWIFNIKDGNLLNFLATKFAIVTSEEELPSDVNWLYRDDIYYMGHQIYENLDYSSVGVTYSEVITYEEYQSTDDLLKYVVANTEDIEEIKNLVGNNSSYLTQVSYGSNSLFGHISSDDSTFMILKIPFDEGWTIFINGEEAKKYEVNGGFIGISVPSGASYLEMYFTPTGFKEGVILSGFGIIIFGAIIIIELKNIKKRRN